MKITKQQLRTIIAEERQKLLSEKMNPAVVELENQLRHTLASYIDTYMTSMNMNPGDPADRRRIYNRIESLTSMIIGEGSQKNRATRHRMIREAASGSDIEGSIQKALEINGVMSGIDLIDYVMNDIPGHVYHQRVADYMDKMLDDGVLVWNIEEDEWRLA